jgi:DNA-binding LacI/PurR family transcriptional regulator
LIKSDLGGRILSGQAPRGQKFYTEKQICEEFQVSITTARRVLNDLAQEGLLVRRQGSGTYVADPRTKRTQTFGMLVPSVTDGHAARLVHGIEKASSAAGQKVLVRNYEDDLSLFAQACRDLATSGIDGAFVYMPTLFPPAYQAKLREGLSVLETMSAGVVVFDGNPMQMLGMSGRIGAVHEDFVQAGYLLTEHLLRQGHQRIAFVHQEHCYTVHARYQGYRQALINAGVEADSALCISADWPVPQIVDHLLVMADRPTAVLALSDFHAAEFIKELHRRGRRVPEDIAVAGYDDLEFAAVILPSLTTIAIPYRSLIDQAMAMMTRMREDPNFELYTLVLPPILQVRESTQNKITLPRSSVCTGEVSC